MMKDVKARSRKFTALRWTMRVVVVFLLLAVGVASLILFQGCAALFPSHRTTVQRLSMFPPGVLPLRQPVTIYWNDYQIPFIVANNDDDLAFTLGLVHAHLRGGQMAVFKRISQGRIAEMVGSVAAEIDYALRLIDFGFAAEQILLAMPPETRAWLDAFVDGLNYHAAHAKRRPPEFALLGITPEPWTAEDVITLGRLGGTDVNWGTFFALLRARLGDNWSEIWSQTVKDGIASPPSIDDQGRVAVLVRLLEGTSKSGSNSVVLSPQRMTSGAAAIANDPHLGLSIPNFWLLCGYKSPSQHCVGLMIPGIPFMALGRNPFLAWGGTNMRAASSDLFDVGALSRATFTTTMSRIKVRFGADRNVQIRHTDLGPVLSDSSLFPAKPGEEIVLKWVGHHVSDEISAFLKANKARTPAEFFDAFDSYAVSGQNMLFADVDGNIGMVMAVQLPERQKTEPDAVVLNPLNSEHIWRGRLKTSDFPLFLNPTKGFIASANNRPSTQNTVGYFFGSGERFSALSSIVEGNGSFSLNDLMTLQQNVYSATARAMSIYFAEELNAHGYRGERDAALVDALGRWDGEYRSDSRDAVVFEVFLAHILAAFVEETGRSNMYYKRWNYIGMHLADDIRALPDSARRAIFEYALSSSHRDIRRYATYGEKHHVKAQHLLANLPLIGGLFVYKTLPGQGARETINKAYSEISAGKTTARYGSQARHISLMDDPDHNYFVLFGGQDGWLGSENLNDQTALWAAGEYVNMPLRVETIKRTFPHKMQLLPGKPFSLD